MPGYSSKKRRLESDTSTPDTPQEGENRKNKRQRQDPESFGNKYGRSSYRPQYGNDDSQRGSHVGSGRANRSFRPDQNDAPQKPFEANNKHRKSYRSTNPSTRIRSLRKQLKHHSAATMPADLLAEKERELAYLESEQKQIQTKKDRSKTIGRYHKVRFFERKKAERNLKRLRRTLQAIEDSEPFPDTTPPTADDIHRAETDLLYTLYSPLEEKYISIFAADHSDPAKRKGKKSDVMPVKTKTEKGSEIEIVKLNDPTVTDFRPAHWHTIATILKHTLPHGTDADTSDAPSEAMQTPSDNEPLTAVLLASPQLRELEALRDGKAPNGSHALNSKATDGLAMRSKDRTSSAQNGAKSQPAWQATTDGAIDPMDADDSSNDDDDDYGPGNVGGGGGVRLGRNTQGEDDSESDGDGGFFE